MKFLASALILHAPDRPWTGRPVATPVPAAV